MRGKSRDKFTKKCGGNAEAGNSWLYYVTHVLPETQLVGWKGLNKLFPFLRKIRGMSRRLFLSSRFIDGEGWFRMLENNLFFFSLLWSRRNEYMGGGKKKGFRFSSLLSLPKEEAKKRLWLDRGGGKADTKNENMGWHSTMYVKKCCIKAPVFSINLSIDQVHLN